MTQRQSDKKAKAAHGVSREEALQAVQTLLRYVGEDPTRDGLCETPDRYCRALLEMTAGYQTDVESLFATTFPSDSNAMVLLRDIEFSSLCEHHLLSFTGKAHVAYLPSQGRILGLSKLARVVDAFASRLQVQEHLTQQIAASIENHLKPDGVAVFIEATHQCMCVRGVRKKDPVMVTLVTLGKFATCPATRQEFFSLIKK